MFLNAALRGWMQYIMHGSALEKNVSGNDNVEKGSSLFCNGDLRVLSHPFDARLVYSSKTDIPQSRTSRSKPRLLFLGNLRKCPIPTGQNPGPVNPYCCYKCLPLFLVRFPRSFSFGCGILEMRSIGDMYTKGVPNSPLTLWRAPHVSLSRRGLWV